VKDEEIANLRLEAEVSHPTWVFVEVIFGEECCVLN
jgi:hypothetical protein